MNEPKNYQPIEATISEVASILARGYLRYQCRRQIEMSDESATEYPVNEEVTGDTT